MDFFVDEKEAALNYDYHAKLIGGYPLNFPDYDFVTFVPHKAILKKSFDKLDTKQVAAVKQLLSIGDLTDKQIANKIGCCRETIRKIRIGLTHNF